MDFGALADGLGYIPFVPESYHPGAVSWKSAYRHSEFDWVW
jgi:hypothetical protein